MNSLKILKLLFKKELLSFPFGLELKRILKPLIKECIKEISWGDKVYNKTDISDKELSDFVDNLNGEQFEKVMKFFNTMPKLRHVIEVENPNTKVKSEVPLEGLKSFLA